MKVSFIVPLYNCLSLTQAMLASLQATVPPAIPHEIIFVDDGSTDGTREWLASVRGSVRVVLNERNLGYAGANNRGAAQASGELLCLLNNDLVLTPSWLEPVLAAHRSLGERAGVIGNVQRNHATGAIDHAGVIINLKAKPEHDTSLPPRWLRFLHRTRRAPAVTGACALVQRALWEKLGGLDEGFTNGGEDVDFCFRVRAEGRINAVALRSIIRHHISSSPGRTLRNESNSQRLASKWRKELEQLALHRWCWHYLDREWTGTNDASTYRDGRAALLFAAGLRRTPPAIAVAGMRTAMDHEFARWQTILK